MDIRSPLKTRDHGCLFQAVSHSQGRHPSERMRTFPEPGLNVAGLNLGYSEHLQLPTWYFFWGGAGKRSFCYEYIQFLPEKKVQAFMSSLLDSYLMLLRRNASAQKEGKVNVSLQSSQVLCLLSPYRYSVGFYEII